MDSPQSYVFTYIIYRHISLNLYVTQHLHVEDGAVIAMTDDLLWGNHYLMKGFDAASTGEILKVGVLDKDGNKLETQSNDKGIFVTVGSDNILDKDKSYRLVNQMNWLLDGRQDLTSVYGDVAFLTNALVDKNGAFATNRMEALASDSGALAETQRMGAQVQTTMLDHASSARKDGFCVRCRSALGRRHVASGCGFLGSEG